MLTAVSMIKSLVKNYQLPHDTADLMMKFARGIPESAPKSYKQPSLSMLVKFWQDAVRILSLI